MLIATTFDTYLEETKDTGSALDLAIKDGFQAMGIMLSEPIEFYQEKKDIFLASDLKFCIHANLIDTNLASENYGIRKESISQLKQAIKFAKEINANIVTFHPGKYRNTHNIHVAYMLLDLSIKEVLSEAINNKITLCIENMEPSFKELGVTLPQITQILDRHKDLSLTLDLAHLAMISNSEDEMFTCINTLKNKIKHIHISGIRPKMSHVEVSLKESEIDFTNIIKFLKDFQGIIRIENREKYKNIESLNFIQNIINT